MKQKRSKIISAAIGTTATYLVMTPQSIYAAGSINVDPLCSNGVPGGGMTDNLTYQGTDGSPGGDFDQRCNVTGLTQIEGRAGANGSRGDYEVGIGPDGAQATVVDQLQIDWVSEQVYNWDLIWDPSTNEATFTVDSGVGSIEDTFTGTPDLLNAFGILARADDPSSKIDAGTTMSFTVNEITINTNPGVSGSIITEDLTGHGVSVMATSGTTRYDKQYYSLNSSLGVNAEITSMSGTFEMNFTGLLNPQDEAARSRIGFKLLLLDPIGLNPPIDTIETVPEPNSMIGLLMAGTFGAASIFSRKKS